MRTLAEIEEAVKKLGHAEQAELCNALTKRLQEREEQKATNSRDELLAKWQKRATEAVAQSGGTQGYLNAIRGRNEDCR